MSAPNQYEFLTRWRVEGPVLSEPAMRLDRVDQECTNEQIVIGRPRSARLRTLHDDVESRVTGDNDFERLRLQFPTAVSSEGRAAIRVTPHWTPAPPR